MPLSEGLSAHATYKFYTSGIITPGTLDNQATAPGASGGKMLRRVSMTPTLKKATYQSQEIRQDRQIADFRHGVISVDGTLSGELSPASYFDFFEATHRDTKTALVTVSQAVLTSITLDGPSSTLTFGGGDPVLAGFAVGDPLQLTGVSAPNLATNFVVTGFSGTSNRTVKVTPPPTTAALASTFTVTRRGMATTVPGVSSVSRKMALEVYHDDLAAGRLFLENRLSGYSLKLPASGLSTVDFTMQGRSAASLTTPYFTSPAPVTTTDICSAVNGALLINGVELGLITAVNMGMALSPTPAEVVGQNFAAEIFLGRANLTGSLSAFLSDTSLLDYFQSEAELELMVQLTTTALPSSPMISIYLPRIKLSSADVNYTGEGGQVVSANFQALKYSGSSAAGKINSTIRIVDTEAT